MTTQTKIAHSFFSSFSGSTPQLPADFPPVLQSRRRSWWLATRPCFLEGAVEIRKHVQLRENERENSTTQNAHFLLAWCWNNKFHFLFGCIIASTCKYSNWARFTSPFCRASTINGPSATKRDPEFLPKDWGCRANCDVFPIGFSMVFLGAKSIQFFQLRKFPRSSDHWSQLGSSLWDLQVTRCVDHAMSFTQFIIAMLLASVGMLLQGCAEEVSESATTSSGCDVAAATTCGTTFATSQTTNANDNSALCAALNTYGTCLQSAACCSDTTLVANLDSNIQTLSPACTGSDAVTNPCSSTWSHGSFGHLRF